MMEPGKSTCNKCGSSERYKGEVGLLFCKSCDEWLAPECFPDRPITALCDAEESIRELEAENAKLKSERQRVDKRIREQRGVLRWWQDHFNMHVSHASRRRLVALDWKWRIIEHYRQMKTVRITVKDTAAEARIAELEARLKEANTALEPFVAEAKKWAKGTAQVHFADDDTIALHIKGNVCGFCGEEPGCDLAAFNVGHLRAARSIAAKIGARDE